MRQLSRFITVVFAAFSSVSLALTSAYAQQQVAVTLKSADDIQSAVGLVFHEGALFQIEDTSVRALGDNLYSISFSPRGYKRTLSNNDNTNAVRVLAIAETVSGELVYASSASLQGARDHVLSGPNCPLRETIANGSRSHSAGIFHQIIEIREEKRMNHRSELENRLTPEFREKLEKLERHFGLSYGEPLTAHLAPYTLVQRLARLQSVTSTFKSTLAKRKNEEATKSEEPSDAAEQEGQAKETDAAG